MTVIESVEQQARSLAADNRGTEPSIKKIYWFPDQGEIRLVQLLDEIPISQDGRIRPFYFRSSPQDGLTFVSSIAMIRPEEFGRLKLPRDWGDWSDAVEIDVVNTMNRRDAFIAQARSDYAIFERLNATGVEYCHRLHYLQMTVEKLAKGILTTGVETEPPEPTHAVFVTLLRALKSNPEIRRRLGFFDRSVFKRYIDSLLEMASKIERLAPAIAGFSRANPEYPWRGTPGGPVIVPAEFPFHEFSPNNVPMRKVLLLVRGLLDIVV